MENHRLTILEEKVARLEEAVSEIRLHYATLNTSLQRALQDVLPKVEALLANTEGNGKISTVSYAPTNSVPYAVLAGDMQTLLKLLENGADIELRTACGDTALHLAAATGNEAILHCLLASGALVNSRGLSHRTPLHQAVVFGRPEASALLLNAGADITLQDADGATPLTLAVRRDQCAIVREMTRGSNLDHVDAEGNSLVVEAAKAKAWGTVKALCDMGASPKKFSGDTNSPLKLAARSGAVEAVVCLLRSGYSGEDRDVLLALSRARNVSVVRAFESVLPGILATTAERALLTAANAGILDSTEALLDAGVDINTRSTPKGLTPVMHASMKGHVECLRLLIRRGAAKDKRDWGHGNTALHLASQNGYEECVGVLLEAGADWKIKNKRGKTAFQVNCLTNPEMVFKSFI